MGLCKCPKKKVTNLFCFEHRVNVCENCLVANHSRCVVQSYLQWLQDSDYDPSCSICQGDLAQDSQETVRLMCYDVYHWKCLNDYARGLPGNTAPAGYSCPKCRGSIFPAPNVQSPVADMLRATLSCVNWARVGLGLPLMEENETPRVQQMVQADQAHSSSVSLPDAGQSSYTRPSAQVSPYSSTPLVATQYQGHTTVDVDGVTQPRGDKSYSTEPKRLFPDSSHLSRADHDDNKYRRRSAFTWLTQWFKSRERSRYTNVSSPTKRYVIIALLAVIAFFTILVIFSRLGHYVTDDDPLLDPHSNPNIRIKDQGVVQD